MIRLATFARRVALIGLLHLLCAALPAAAADLASGASVPPAPAISRDEALAELKRVQAALDRIKQQASAATTYKQLDALDESTQALSADVDKLTAALVPTRAQLQAQLDVLGPPPAPGAAPETPAVARQRADLNARKTQLDAALKQAADEKESLANLTQQYSKLRRSLLRDQLVLRSSSILGPRFWAPLFRPSDDDRQELGAFSAQIGQVLAAAWEPGRRLGTALLLAAALAVWTLGRRLAERALAWFSLTKLPETRVRRSALATSIALSSVVTTGIAVQFVYLALTRDYALSSALQDFADELAKLALTCALIAGLGRALLCTHHPSWRLPALADEVALAMRPFPAILAALLLVAGALEELNRTADTSLQVTLFGRGIVSLVVVVTIGASLLRANRARTALAALLIGYISVARFLTYELVWFEIVIGSVYLLTRLTRDAYASAFAANLSSGRLIKHLFGLNDSHLDQARTVLTGISTSVLLLVAVIALLTGGFGTTPNDLLVSVISMFGGDKLQRLNIVPARILNAALALAIGIYLLRSVRRWLDNELLPAIGLDQGMRASLVTLFSNLGYVALVLLALSLLGVKWDNLAWIVSALSVGIGFGLQEIVKNFVSGLILLTERPVKVGDMISISGVEGDIRRINVRATEIQLSDRSTVIVPNSQLISQNLRNVTMGNSTQGVATLMLTFPLNTDPEQVRDLLLDAYREHASVLEKPAPSVTFSQLTPDGITLSVTGYVGSPRIAAATKSDLLFEILKRLRAAGIALSNPQTLMVQNLPPPSSE
ncbi:mechanosensitive ion channel family protein [Burkholderia pseudomallei]|nr:mechanosensitive ion channel family protein [Burkholderia pseudomallei]CAJ3671202.1 mechanosensitive ion channel family protein [Burkholderia pseudomallei]